MKNLLSLLILFCLMNILNLSIYIPILFLKFINNLFKKQKNFI